MKNSTFDNLYNLYRENKLSHAYLIESNNVEKTSIKLKKLIKKMNCKSEYKENCEECNLCNLLDNLSLPSYIEIWPDGKSIKKDQIELVTSSFIKKPLYTDNNIYVIHYPEKMNSIAFNKLLKFIEEPESNIIGFLVSNNKDYVAPTIVSRCEILKDIDDVKTIYDYDLTKKIISSDNIAMFLHNLSTEENFDRTKLVEIFKEMFSYYKNIDKNLQKQLLIKKYLEELNYNVNIDIVIDSFAIEMGDIDGI